MKNPLLRPAMIVVPLVLGIFFPQASVLKPLIRWGMIAMLFMVYLQLDLRELKPRMAHWVILGANIAVGVAGFLIFQLTGHRELAWAAFFVGITPTATAAPVIMNFLNGRVGFVVSGLVITNVGVSLALLPLIPAVTGNMSWRFALDVFTNLVVIMVLPCVAALAVRKFRPEAAMWPKKFKMLSLSIWSLLLFIISAGASQFLRTNADVSPFVVVEIAAIAAAICAVNFTLGYWIVPRELRREGSQTLGQKNTMLTLYLAMTFASPLAALGPTFYVICHNCWNACQLFIYDRKQKRERKEL